MEKEIALVEGTDMHPEDVFNPEETFTVEMETEDNEIGSPKSEIQCFSSEMGEGSNVIFSREAPLISKEPRVSGVCSCSATKIKSHVVAMESEIGDKENFGQEKKLSKQDRIELGRMFQSAVSCHDWKPAESLILLADPQTLNDALCITLDSIWFLSTQQELDGITGLIKKIIANGAYDFTRAALRTSFLASCVSACQSQTMHLEDTVNVMAQRLKERLKECNGDEVLKAEASAKVQKFTEWALKCIGFHSRCQANRDRVIQSSIAEIQLQLSAFKTFLDLAGNQLTGKDFTEAFDAAWGADNVNQCFLEASRFGSTELVRILLQIAHWNSLDVDVDLALGFASHYCKIGTMECLVEEGNAIAFLGPLMRAAERGCMQVVQWFVKRGCRDMELCLALTAATSSSQVDVAGYLLPHVPHHVLAALSIEILKAAGERSGGSLDGVAFLLCSDFLGDPTATYAVADSIARSDDESVAPELRAFLREHWSEAAYLDGLKQGQEHYLNLVRVLNWGGSPISLRDLPGPLRVAVAYLPLYRECVATGGRIFSQKQRGQLVEAVRKLGGVSLEDVSQGKELLAVLEHYLPPFLVHTRSMP
ncbi:ANKYRIN REPEAT PROTEIN SKIP35 [Salix purpurea]|uniref:ANKYRIN REPEAT PROTEIN SKIP35 n=1 Tax=Salix purpurea TaxID=77065 RepID=A0A9Q0V560_SALPP|nr:ANKYRIN REPEAT PROTEIN SKIP35 [Salix purpurea]KAJ6741383.1 ANKYRIN REPEAT PROTEIN SKIP35 [Salix purpurea]